jgi:hypothetical protein
MVHAGSVGDSYDNDDGGSQKSQRPNREFQRLYKSELICCQSSWTGLDGVEFVTGEYGNWYNHRRAHDETLPGPRYIAPPRHEANPSMRTVTADPAMTQASRRIGPIQTLNMNFHGASV